MQTSLFLVCALFVLFPFSSKCIKNGPHFIIIVLFVLLGSDKLLLAMQRCSTFSFGETQSVKTQTCVI